MSIMCFVLRRFLTTIGPVAEKSEMNTKRKKYSYLFCWSTRGSVSRNSVANILV